MQNSSPRTITLLTSLASAAARLLYGVCPRRRRKGPACRFWQETVKIIDFSLALSFAIASLPLSAELCVEKAEMGMGYRQDHLDWNIAAPTYHPNVLSELEWTHLQSAAISACAEVLFRSLYVGAWADYARIFAGKQRDSDYKGDNRTEEYSRSRAVSDRGELLDLSAGVGWSFPYRSFVFRPLMGYSLNEQHLRHRKAVQVMDTEYPLLVGPIRGLHDNYRAKWFGPWIGLNSHCQISNCFALEGLLEYHWPRYKGTGHWGSRHDFYKDFEHEAHGNGILAALGGSYKVEPCWSFGLMGIYRKFTTDKGRDRKFFLARIGRGDGEKYEVPVSFDTRLNRVRWTSFGVRFYGSYTF